MQYGWLHSSNFICVTYVRNIIQEKYFFLKNVSKSHFKKRVAADIIFYTFLFLIENQNSI